MSKLVVIDGLPSPAPHPDVSDHEQRRFTSKNLADWLDHRRNAAANFRKPGTLEELARRRKRMNPRLSDEWLLYLASIGARKDADGRRWKLDPAIRFGGFGPWRPDWSMSRLKTLPVPLLGLTATVEEEMGWGTNHKALEPLLPPGGRLVPFEATGHFIHIEHPRRVADMVLDFLG
jgi:pimeloyl-ACP methyl ester carboxylesterase